MFHRMYFSTDKLIGLAKKFFLRVGLLVEDEAGRLVDQNGNEEIDSDSLANLVNGPELCADFMLETSEDSQGRVFEDIRVGFNEFFLATDPAVADWDCNRGDTVAVAAADDDGLGDI